MTESIVALITLIVLEIVLGIDNVIFISILAGKLPQKDRARARQIGIGLAVVSRILLLFSISFIVNNLTEGFLSLPFREEDLSGRDLILLVGGMFLIGKSTYEIHEKLEGEDHHAGQKAVSSFVSVLVQIMLIDVVFSLDSVITAVGIAEELWVMVVAVLVAAGVMLAFAGVISSFVEKHPTMKILALAFLILIGSLLVIEGWAHAAAEELHLKNYAYFAMAFSVIVEIINLRVRKQSAEPVKLHKQPSVEEIPQA